MKNKKTLIYIGIPILLITILAISYFSFFYNPWKFTEDRPIKIFWLDSNNMEDFMAAENIQAFKSTLEEEGIDFEMEEFHLNAMKETSVEVLTEAGKEAMKMIDEYHPDLIYATDDNAQVYAAVNYANTNTPLVFSGMNKEPKDYGYDKAKNVAGVLEREHFIESAEMLKEIYPNVKKVAVVMDQTAHFEGMFNRMKEESKEIPDIEFIGWHRIFYFEDFKQVVLDYQDKADALIMPYINSLRDEEDNRVPVPEIRTWLIENNKLPDVSFWRFVIGEGALAGYEVSFTEQGSAAAEIAKKILINGETPSKIPFEKTTTGQRMINLKRAESLGLEREDIPSVILVNSRIYENYSWETE